ncbi:MAG: 3-hydroxyisobutyrate dehydrogenase [Solirubrobacteraceae bacterium]|jgi:3-hydroxyisobutyrate dehydrogenase|nr:3-hydroxyisobutyrate dehydrogenase [Solirubrobacteraceae bacterium]
MTAGEQTVAVLGAGGTMGRGLAANIARSGLSVRAWNRSLEKAEPLAAEGAAVCASPAEAADGADVVLTMLTDADAVLEVAEPALAEAGPDAVWLQMSTIGIDGTDRCAAVAEKYGVAFVDAPVLGTKQPAEQGELIVLASGPEGIRDRVQPIFDAVGRRTLWVGEAGAGSRLKLVTNAWIVSLVEGAAEMLVLAEGLGLDPAVALDAITGGPLDLPYLQLKAHAMIERDFEPSFKLALAAKDAGLAGEAADAAGLDLPALRAIRERFEQAAREHGDEDLSAVFLAIAPKR